MPKWARCGRIAATLHREGPGMISSRCLAALLLSAILAAPQIAAAAGEDSPKPPPPTNQGKQNTQTKKPKTDKSSSAELFLRDYHAAYALIYDKADFEGGIAALRALGYDDHPDVATLIGYASRKLGRYDDAKIWYERALAADPDHAVTWAYYGIWPGGARPIQ